jgi:hypothetical protein
VYKKSDDRKYGNANHFNTEVLNKWKNKIGLRK